MRHLDDLSLFASVAEHGSLSAAGRALNMPKATLSRRLAALEGDLGTKLVRRSTRTNALTDAGRQLHARIAPLVMEAKNAVAEIRDAAMEPSGLVRITASAAFGQIVLMPVLTQFLREYPKVRLDLTLSDKRVPIAEQGFDLAVRMGALEDSDLLSKQLARIKRRVVGSRDYFAARGVPRSLHDLRSHLAVVISPELDRWPFEREGQVAELRMPWRMATGDMLSLAEAAKQGIGIALLPAFLADPAVQAGALVALDLDATAAPAVATILFPRAKIPSPATRRLIDFVADRIGCMAEANDTSAV